MGSRMNNTARTFLIHGLIAGLIAGVAAFLVAYAVGEPPIDAAIAVEEAQSENAHDHAHEDAGDEGHSHGDEGGVTRSDQAGPGLATATVAIGGVLGGLVGVVSAFAVGRIGRMRAATSTAVVGAVGFVSFALVPWIAYPPNPPATGSADTIGQRTTMYFAFLLVSIVAAIGAVAAGRAIARSASTWAALVLATVGYIAVIAIAYALLGPIDEVPDDFPANTLYSFRISALATQATLWAVLVAVLTGLVQRTSTREKVVV